MTNIWLHDVDRVEAAVQEVARVGREDVTRPLAGLGPDPPRLGPGRKVDPKALAAFTNGLEAAKAIGARRLEAMHLGLAAEAQSRAGKHANAKATIAEAFSSFESRPDTPFLVDLHRRRAAIALRAKATATAVAITDLERALAVSREQETPSLELRAARDLARLWAERSDRQQALDLLAPVYDRFTEGFDTPDLVEAKALLDKLR